MPAGTGSGGQKKGGVQPPEEEERILISEVEVVGVGESLKRVAYDALTVRPNFAYTLRDVETDLRRVFATGWFSSCVPDAEDTRDGIKLVIKVRAGAVHVLLTHHPVADSFVRTPHTHTSHTCHL